MEHSLYGSKCTKNAAKRLCSSYHGKQISLGRFRHSWSSWRNYQFT